MYSLGCLFADEFLCIIEESVKDFLSNSRRENDLKIFYGGCSCIHYIVRYSNLQYLNSNPMTSI